MKNEEGMRIVFRYLKVCAVEGIPRPVPEALAWERKCKFKLVNKESLCHNEILP